MVFVPLLQYIARYVIHEDDERYPIYHPAISLLAKWMGHLGTERSRAIYFLYIQL